MSILQAWLLGLNLLIFFVPSLPSPHSQGLQVAFGIEGLIRRTREVGSEWEPIKILLEGDGNSNKMNKDSNTRL
jgi:hypothetical protein